MRRSSERKGRQVAEVKCEPDNDDVEYPPARFVTHEMFYKHQRSFPPVSLLPEQVSQGIDGGYPDGVDEPPPGPEKAYLL